MEKIPELRIGNTPDEQQIRSHPFFSHLDWAAIEQRQIDAPFLPVSSKCSRVSGNLNI